MKNLPRRSPKLRQYVQAVGSKGSVWALVGEIDSVVMIILPIC